MQAENPLCPACQTPTQRRPAAIRLHGRADPGPSQAERPRSWEQVNKGDPETVRGWQKAIEQREKLEAKYPELAGDNRPVLAHEGIFARNPLRVGDDLARSIAQAAQASSATKLET
jgi:hypothetical protein